MKRRLFIAATMGALGLAPYVANGQRGRVPLLGILRLNPPRASYEHAFLDALQDMGYVAGKNLVIEDRDAAGDASRLPVLAAELARIPATAIFARGAQALAAAKRATDTIPIVAFDDAIDPVRNGYAASLAQPAGNVTGVFVDMPELVGKWLELLTLTLPRLARIAVLWDPSTGSAQREAVESAAHSLSKQLWVFEVRDSGGFQTAFVGATQSRAEAMLMLSSQLMRINSKAIADFAMQARMPSVAPYRDFPEKGGLMSYGPSLPESFRRCGAQLGKILVGAKASDLPIERPDRFSLVLNSGTAKALGLSIPRSLLARADEVIQ